MAYSQAEPRDYEAQSVFITIIDTVRADGSLVSRTVGQIANDTFKLNYTPSPIGARVRIGNDIDSQFTAADLSENTAQSQVFTRRNGEIEYNQLIYSNLPWGENFQYIALAKYKRRWADAASFRITERQWLTFIGQPTRANELRTTGIWSGTGTMAYDLSPEEDPNAEIGSQITFTTNWAGGTISGEGVPHLVNGVRSDVRYTLAGLINKSDNTVSGTIRSNNGVYDGEFNGRFYGPRGDELGIHMVLRRSGYPILGVIVAKLNGSQTGG